MTELEKAKCNECDWFGNERDLGLKCNVDNSGRSVLFCPRCRSENLTMTNGPLDDPLKISDMKINQYDADERINLLYQIADDHNQTLAVASERISLLVERVKMLENINKPLDEQLEELAREGG